MLENGSTSEIAMVGNEGMIGVALLVDSHSTPTRAVIQAAGTAYALRAEIVHREFKRGGEFQFIVLRYTQALLTQMAQARRLQDEGCIRYSRGVIQVLDRNGLLTRSCECYGVVQREYERLLSFRGR